MYPTERLNLLWLEMSQNKAMAADLKGCIEAVYQTEAYQKWHRETPRAPFAFSKCGLASQSKWMAELGLVENDRLLIKINRLGDRLFLTDGAWVSHPLRVFPDPDEARILIDHVERRGHELWADWIIDPAAGCGHTPLGYRGKAKRFSCDANARAVLYARVNAKLNGFNPDHFMAVLNDMNEGFPPSLSLTGNVLFLANVPFAPAPNRSALAVNSAGGETGADLQLASFRMVKEFHARTGQPTRGCFLTWTVGSAEDGIWEVPEFCREMFEGQRVDWTLIHDDYDAPDLPNPAPLSDTLRYLAASQYAVGDSVEKREAEYVALSKELMARGHTHVAYGMLEVDLS